MNYGCTFFANFQQKSSIIEGPKEKIWPCCCYSHIYIFFDLQNWQSRISLQGCNEFMITYSPRPLLAQIYRCCQKMQKKIIICFSVMLLSKIIGKKLWSTSIFKFERKVHIWDTLLDNESKKFSPHFMFFQRLKWMLQV